MRAEEKRESNNCTYSTRRCLSPAKSALVILVRLFAFRSLDTETGQAVSVCVVKQETRLTVERV